jgi:DNA-binding transcriptional LysR family regulator
MCLLGTFSEYTVVPAASVVKVDNGTALDKAALGGIPFAPGWLAQPVTEFDLAGDGVRARPEMEPSQEFPGCLLDYRPGTIPRADVAAVIAALLDNRGTRHQTLELVSGNTPVAVAVHSIS